MLSPKMDPQMTCCPAYRTHLMSAASFAKTATPAAPDPSGLQTLTSSQTPISSEMLTPRATTTNYLALMPASARDLVRGIRKKPPGPQALLASVWGANSSVYYVTNSNSIMTYLVDSGAEVSIIPCDFHVHDHVYPYSNVNSPCLFTANSSKIPTYGIVSYVAYQGTHHYTGKLFSAPVHHPIIRANFLLKHYLLVDSLDSASCYPDCSPLSPADL